MIRKTLLVITLVLLVGTVGLWVRSYQRHERVGWNGNPYHGGVAWRDGNLILTLTRLGAAPAGPRPFYFVTKPAVGQPIESSFAWGRRHPLVPGLAVNYWVRLPLWVFMVALSIAALVFARPWYRRYYRHRHNLCLTCGYDLTGNVSGRCPDCGTIVPGSATERR